MNSVFHILNGDSLKYSFPSDIEGEKIVCRECLVDGNTNGSSLEEFYQNRAAFLSSYFTDRNISLKDYENVSLEFDKIQDIPENAEVNLWFEEDLFCQVNLWFVFYLLKTNNKTYSINLVLPSKECRYSFYDMSPNALGLAFKNKLDITNEVFEILSKFWELFRNSESDEVYLLAENLGENFQFLLPTIKAWQENRPKNTLRQIVIENDSLDFWSIFNKFKEKEAIYGFGDLQVKRLLAEISAEK